MEGAVQLAGSKSAHQSWQRTVLDGIESLARLCIILPKHNTGDLVGGTIPPSTIHTSLAISYHSSESSESDGIFDNGRGSCSYILQGIFVILFPICLLKKESWIGLEWQGLHRACEWNCMRPACIFTFWTSRLCVKRVSFVSEGVGRERILSHVDT